MKCKKNLMNKSSIPVVHHGNVNVAVFSGERTKAPKSSVAVNRIRQKMKGKGTSKGNNGGGGGGAQLSGKKRKERNEKIDGQRVAKRMKMGDKKKMKDRA